MTSTALILVDIQNDFCEGGSLAVEGGADVADRVARHVAGHHDDYAVVVATRDWHIDPGEHFAGEEEPDFAERWPVHCAAGTPGADFHPAVAGAVDRWVDAEFRKGQFEAAYSGFEGAHAEAGHDLDDWLQARDVEAVEVVGLATDHCVRATAVDAVHAGFATTVLTDLVAAVAPDTEERALAEMAGAGVELRRSTDSVMDLRDAVAPATVPSHPA